MAILEKLVFIRRWRGLQLCLILALCGVMLVLWKHYHDQLYSIEDRKQFAKIITNNPKRLKQASKPRGLIGNFTDDAGRIFLPSDTVTDGMTFNDLEDLYHRYIEAVQILCLRQIHLGHEQDGGYHLCEDEGVAPGNPCLVYSFGCHQDFTFEDDLSTMYECEIHTFDPSDGQDNHKHSKFVTFHKLGIGNKNYKTDKGWDLRTLDTFRRDFKHDTKLMDVLKIDIEYAEWPSLEQILVAGSLKNVKQLIVEFHMWSSLVPETGSRTADDIRKHIRVLRGIYEAGFRIFFLRMYSNFGTIHRDANGKERTGCHEVHFINLNYMYKD